MEDASVVWMASDNVSRARHLIMHGRALKATIVSRVLIETLLFRALMEAEKVGKHNEL